MLKGKCDVSACSLSSCRVKAESLARAVNNRIWPNMWTGTPKMTDDGPNDEEEFFDASPSPIDEDGEEFLSRSPAVLNDANSAAGRAKLYELLQLHVDDATDVFYDVSENAGSVAGDTNVSQTPCTSEFAPDCAVLNKVPDEFKLNCNLVPASDDVASGTPVYEADVTQILTLLENSNLVDESNGIIEAFPSGTEILDTETKIDTNYETDNIDLNDLPIDDYDPENIYETITITRTDPETSEDDVEQINESNYSTLIQESDKICKKSKFIDIPLGRSSIEDNSDNQLCPVISIQPSSPPKFDKLSTDSLKNLGCLDDNRPALLRTTSLKTGKTPPGTPSRKKIVRFADVLGLDLEDVRQIISSDLPNVPSSAFTDLHLPDVEIPTPVPTVQLQSTQVIQSPNALYPLFSMPGYQSDFIERVRSQGVCLDSAVVSEFTIQCTCKVMNWGFHKKLIARYTVNEWLSSNDIDASYVSSTSHDEMDVFTFSIFLSPLNKSVKFALRYLVNGKEYWDNNRGSNYCFGYHGDRHANESSSTWLHHFC